ncbi:MAG: glycosyltransferase [Bacteroidales bacterium]|jgi:glycosyltransferase involved in cell wall biosynthesis|nr:glycosyltransferase [Bacteroidales bacterium]
MNKLTAIIPFLNEGSEIERTLASIRETAGECVDIILINDCSEDDTDYKAVAIQYGARYYYNAIRQGVARSRDIGVELCETPYFILFDGHMRFYYNHWWNEVTKVLDNNDRAAYCLRCFPLDGQFKIIDSPKSMGACINMDDNSGNSILDIQWRYMDAIPDESLIPISCLIGACYAMSKRYWQYLKGLNGLRTYGCDEAYLSLKTWLEGGVCLLMKDIKVGHIFRQKAPYEIITQDFIYNKLLIAETVFPIANKTKIFSELHRSNPDVCDKAMMMLYENRQLVSDLKNYYRQIFTRDISTFIQFDQSRETTNKFQ